MRLQAMSPQEQADLYDASAPVWAGMGITKDIWLRNLAAARAHNEAVEPLRLVYEAALAISPSEAVRDAVQTYQQALKEHGWMNPQNKGSAVNDCVRACQEATRVYDAAILAAGDERVIEAKRAYDDAERAARARFVKSLR